MPSSIAQAIATMEGYFTAGTIADRNNNPGNLLAMGQAGQIGVDSRGFAIFATPEDGWNALENQISLDASRGLTLTEFLNKYAPSSQNNTQAYIDFVSQRTGLDPNALLSAGLDSANPTHGSPRSAAGLIRTKTPKDPHHGQS